VSPIPKADIEQRTAEPAPRPCRIDEERTDAGCLSRRIEQLVGAVLPLIAAEQRAPPAPAAGRDDCAVRFDDVIRGITDELRIDAEHEPERALDLRGVVVRGTQLAHRALDQSFDGGNIVALRHANVEVLGHATTFADERASRYRGSES
jgi:hypothetical protein